VCASFISFIGGSVIFTHAGDDCTDIFEAFHSSLATTYLKKFEIGELDESVIPSALYANKLRPEAQKKFEAAYRELRRKMVTMGLFKASIPFYIYKTLSTYAVLATSIFLVVKSTSFFGHFMAAIVLGLFWQQTGWLAHDYLHHQVFKRRLYGDLAGLIIGNLSQGFSVQWWKSKHNSHHAVPNLLASVPGACDGDPDIDTMPYLAWTLKMAEIAKESPMGRFLVKIQALTYFPLLLFARLAWAHQSWVFVYGGAGQHSVTGANIDRQHIQYPVIEKTFLVLHYVGLCYIMSFMPLTHAIMYFLVAQMSCGLFLAIVFGLGHNGMAVYPADSRPDFWKLQVTTTRNVKNNFFVEWFFGGLQYQVDHHLFPSLPRNNLGKAHALVESFCKEHNVQYHETNIWDGTVEVLSHLSAVSKEFLKEFPGM
jgi:fatty acid desaturase